MRRLDDGLDYGSELREIQIEGTDRFFRVRVPVDAAAPEKEETDPAHADEA